MTQFTPGPWRAVKSDAGNHKPAWFIDAGPLSNHHKTGFILIFMDDEAESNAKLVAAAPDLLRACKEVLELESTRFGFPTVTRRLLALAVAKAESK